MFISFFFELRRRGLKVSLNEWMSFLDAMDKELHGYTVYGFYELCRCMLVKRESDFDLFDVVFMDFFGDLATAPTRELPAELLEWLERSPELSEDEIIKLVGSNDHLTMEEVLKRFEEILAEQTERHDGGTKWIGTQGYTPYGNSGKKRGGMRVGGKSMHRSAFMVAGQRRYRDFRNDNTLDTRQFQVAFRKLRQLSRQSEEDMTDLDIDETVRKTGDNAGTLKIVYKRPRKNNIKVMLLMDSGGSMDYFAGICSMLFQAAEKSNIFKDLKVFYFHNCVYERLYDEPTLRDMGTKVDKVLNTYDSEYKIIFVGDAMMAPSELHYKPYNWSSSDYSIDSGLDRLRQFKEKYPYVIWLNPQPRASLSSYWAQTYDEIGRIIDMYDLTVSGLEQGIKRLLSR